MRHPNRLHAGPDNSNAPENEKNERSFRRSPGQRLVYDVLAVPDPRHLPPVRVLRSQARPEDDGEPKAVRPERGADCLQPGTGRLQLVAVLRGIPPGDASTATFDDCFFAELRDGVDDDLQLQMPAGRLLDGPHGHEGTFRMFLIPFLLSI